MRFNQSNRFKFTRRNIVNESFYYNADIHFIKEKLYEYNSNDVAVHDYIVLHDKGYESSFSVLFRIIKPRYQIAYKDKYGKVYYGEKTYKTFKQAQSAIGAMIFNKELPETHAYYVETIFYLDEQI